MRMAGVEWSGSGQRGNARRQARMVRGLAGVLALWGGAVPAQDFELELLRAAFDDKPADQPIGTGGAAVGEPFAVQPGLDAIVRAGAGADRELEVSAGTLVSAAAVQFGLLNDLGVQSGTVRIDLVLTMPTLSYFYIGVREPRWSAHGFTTIYFLDDGGISAQDAAGSVPLAAYSYAAGVPQHVRLTFDMDARTYGIEINDTPLVTSRAHGIADAGVGQLQLSVPHASAPQLYRVDDIVVTWMFADPVFADGFDAEPAASP